MSLSLVMRYRPLHVQYSACTTPTCQMPEKFLYSLYIRKFTQLLVIRTKLANWQNRGYIVAIATKSGCQILCHPRFKTGKSPQNWQNLAHVYNTVFATCQIWQKTGKKTGKRMRHSSHTNNRSVAHPPHQVVQRVVQQSPQRLVKTPLIEDLLDPDRPRNGLIDGRLALQVVVVQD